MDLGVPTLSSLSSIVEQERRLLTTRLEVRLDAFLTSPASFIRFRIP